MYYQAKNGFGPVFAKVNKTNRLGTLRGVKMLLSLTPTGVLADLFFKRLKTDIGH